MKIFTLGVITAAILLCACGSSDKKKDKPTPPANPAPVVTGPFYQYMGTWELPGTGNIWHFNKETFTAYNFNSYGCVKIHNESLKVIEDITNNMSLNEGKNRLIFDDKASNPEVWAKRTGLPTSCEEQALLSSTNIPDNFEYLWHTMNDYYAFFQQKGVDWQAVYQTVKPQITNATTEEEFIELIDEVFSVFADGHLSLTNKQGESADGLALNGFKLEVLRSSLVDADDDFELAWHQLKQYRENALRALLKDNMLKQHAQADAIRWGQLADNTGYIRIDRLYDLAETGARDFANNMLDQLANIEQDLQITDTIMTSALGDLANNDVIIIDLRFNGGGWDNVGRKIAGYFTDKGIKFGEKRILNNKHQADPYTLTISPAETGVFTKPVYVITGRTTGSGGEVLSMAFKALEHATLIGEPTNGSVSDMLSHDMPNGWELTLSHEVYTDTTGAMVETLGVTPDVTLPAYASQDIIYYSDTPIDHALQLAEISPSFVPTKAQVDAAFDQYFVPTNVPGIAVAVIKDNKVVYQHARGFANIEEKRPITLDTPFNVGSTSKAILATAIMQLVEQDQISLQDKLTDMSLGFDPNNPNNEDKNMTLRHLVTHTSGIKDSAGYTCSYFVQDTEQPLYQTFGIEGCPLQATTDTTAFFIHDYFNPNGKYYMDGAYLPEKWGFPDTIVNYTNVGAGLAGYAIEQKLNINLMDYMSEHIFQPLSMFNTHWDYRQLNENNPKAIQYMLDNELNPLPVPEFSYPTKYDGDLNTSVNDLTKFLLAIINKGKLDDQRILKAESVAQMLSPQTDILGGNDVQGVFWYQDGSFIGHDGGDPGTNAIMKYNQATGVGLIVLMNGEDSHFGAEEVDGMLMPLIATLYRYGLGQ